MPANTGFNFGYAPVNGLSMYYESHGTGAPLILLHGGLGSTESFAQLMPAFLSSGHRVIAADLQGHGRTADIDRPLSAEAMADDIAALMTHLALDQAAFLGYSLGAAVSLRVAIQHPGMVQKLVLVSTVFSRDGWYPEVRAAMDQMGPSMAEMMKQSPPYKIYRHIAPRPLDWPILITKMGELLRKNYNWSKEVAAIAAPTMLVYGDADAVRPEHMIEFYKLLGGGSKDAGWDGAHMPRNRLAILPDVTHYNILTSPLLIPTVMPFLNTGL